MRRLSAKTATRKRRNSKTTRRNSSSESKGPTSTLVTKENHKTTTTTTKASAASTTTGPTNTEKRDAFYPLEQKLPLPLVQLDQYYRTVHQIVNVYPTCFKYELVDDHHGKEGSFWTATFTCPVTKRTFRSGFFRSELITSSSSSSTSSSTTSNSNERLTTTTSNDTANRKTTKRLVGFRDILAGADRALELSHPKVRNKKSAPSLHPRMVWYPKKSAAGHAAAAQAMDVLRYEYDGTLEPRLCEEDPSSNSVTLRNLTKNKKKKKKTNNGEEEDTKMGTTATSKTSRSSSHKSSSSINDLLYRNNPLWELDHMYRQRFQVETAISTLMRKQVLVLLSSASSSKPLVTAHFTCPVTHHVFEAGELRPLYYADLCSNRGGGGGGSGGGSSSNPTTTTTTIGKSGATTTVEDSKRNRIFIIETSATTATTTVPPLPAGGGDDPAKVESDGTTLLSSSTATTKRVCYYPNKSLAIQAAAARALDYFRYQQNPNALEPRLCQENPSLVVLNTTTATTTATSNAGGAMMATDDMSAAAAAANTDLEEEDDDEEEEEKESGVDPILFKGTPTLELDQFYKEKLQNNEHLLEDLMEVEMVSRRGLGQLWTAEFKCPISGRVFESGTLRPEGKTKGQEDQQSFEIVEHKRKRLFYRRKNMAIQAAAARALDIFRFEKDGTLEPRLCEEDPLDDGNKNLLVDDDAVVGEQEDLQKQAQVKDAALLAERDDDGDGELILDTVDEKLLLEIPDEPVDVLIAGTTPDFTSLPSLSSLTKDVGPFEWKEDYDDKDDNLNELYVYQPPTIVDGKDKEESPALRILSSLAGSFTASSSASTLPTTSTTLMVESNGDATTTANLLNVPNAVGAGSTLVQSEDDRIRRVEQEALVWVASVAQRKASTNLHGVDLPQTIPSSALFIAKSLLASLAECNQSCILPSNSSKKDDDNSTVCRTSTELTASKILNMLWASETVSPDADAYNLYLQCLEGPDPVTRALRAESIFQRMKNQTRLRGFVPPVPNTGTYNTLLHLWAQVGGANGRYSKLEESFEPNRDSFLAVLSSSSYVDSEHVESESNVFDLEFAKQCVQRMATLHQETGNDSFQPDTAILNAPMRWSGGLLWQQSRPNTRRIPWDDQCTIYRNGFRPVSSNNALVRNAEQMQEWVQYMGQEYNVQPNVETYEALIQAWVRTGTREGLEKAEAIVHEHMSSPSSSAPVRIQTLHPILAAWLHVKDKDSASRIMKWIEFLRSKDEATRDALQMDLRFLCLEIATNLLQQQDVSKHGAAQALTAAAVDSDVTVLDEQPATVIQEGRSNGSDATEKSATRDEPDKLQTDRVGEDCQVKAEMNDEVGQQEPESETFMTDADDPLELPRQCSLLFKKLAQQIDDAPVEEHSTLLPLLASPAMLTLTAWGRSGLQLGKDLESSQTVMNAMVDVLDVYENVLRDVAAKEAESFERQEVRSTGLSDELRSAVFDALEVFHCLVVQMYHTTVAFRLNRKLTNQSYPGPDIVQPHLVRLEQMCRRLEEFSEIGFMGNGLDHSSKLVFADRFDYRFPTLILGAPSTPVESRSSFHWKIVEMLDGMPPHLFSRSDISDVVRFCSFQKDVIRSGGVRRGPKLYDLVDGILNQILPGRRRQDSILASMKVEGRAQINNAVHVPGMGQYHPAPGKLFPQRGHIYPPITINKKVNSIENMIHHPDQTLAPGGHTHHPSAGPHPPSYHYKHQEQRIPPHWSARTESKRGPAQYRPHRPPRQMAKRNANP
ncbi:hypothetical protein ACA910_021815 [Epithemia clementina (nom. ined.)]